jgi:hypothetical protein
MELADLQLVLRVHTVAAVLAVKMVTVLRLQTTFLVQAAVVDLQHDQQQEVVMVLLELCGAAVDPSQQMRHNHRDYNYEKAYLARN